MILQENGEESLEQLQELFEEMFQGDMEAFASTSQMLFTENNVGSTSFSPSFDSGQVGHGSSNKWNSAEMSGCNAESSSAFHCHFQDFSLGVSIGPTPSIVRALPAIHFPVPARFSGCLLGRMSEAFRLLIEALLCHSSTSTYGTLSGSTFVLSEADEIFGSE